MRVLFLILFLFSFSFALESANDFTVTDLNGTEHSLYDYLDNGKHVLFEFVSSS